MASTVGNGINRVIQDVDGEAATVTNNRLDVNATLVAGTSIDIGDVDIHLSGNVPLLGGAGDVATGVLRITIADDDNQFGEIGDDAAVAGNIHAQLRYIGNTTGNLQTELESVDSRLTTISAIQTSAVSTTGAQYTEGDGGWLATGVRNDTLASLVSVDHDHAPFQVNADGALYVTGNSIQAGALNTYNFTVMGETKTIDGSALPNVTAEGRNARLAVSQSGIAYTCLTDDTGASDLGTTITTHLSEIEGAIETIEAAVDTQMQVDVVAALPAGTNAIGKVGHDITGILSDDNPTVGTSAEAITTDGVDGAAACKRMDIMAHPANTGEIWVGDAAVTTNGLNGGIRLMPGDVYSIDIDNTGDIYVVATVSGENVSYNYFT